MRLLWANPTANCFHRSESEKREMEQTLSRMKVSALEQATLINNILISEASITKTLAHKPCLDKGIIFYQ
jgi:hypothetical protein